jgi:hypothetical protein
MSKNQFIMYAGSGLFTIPTPTISPTYQGSLIDVPFDSQNSFFDVSQRSTGGRPFSSPINLIGFMVSIQGLPGARLWNKNKSSDNHANHFLIQGTNSINQFDFTPSAFDVWHDVFSTFYVDGLNVGQSNILQLYTSNNNVIPSPDFSLNLDLRNLQTLYYGITAQIEVYIKIQSTEKDV